ncbi:precursor of CEP14-like [Diospyros lotus]|uniref:precursor of CEP14-like n=1 Tax=Diospyros lotus TaxID=55363 RepID=UPI00224D8586|nr:precursor of CEP14-like [Diospyros lotus]
MGGSKLGLLMLFMVVLAASVSSSHGRKLRAMQEKKKGGEKSLADRLYLSALPKGKVAPSGPSKKGHAEIVDEKLIARHLAELNRILGSVPSPGDGH